MGHPSALHRPEYPHISPTFLSCPCLQQAVRQKTHSTRGYQMLNMHTSSRMKKMLPGVHVIIAAHRHGSNKRNCAYSNNSRHHNSTPKRTPVTNAYIKMYEHVMLSAVASSLSQRPSRNATEQLRSLAQRAAPRLPKTFLCEHLFLSACDRYVATSLSSLSQHSSRNATK